MYFSVDRIVGRKATLIGEDKKPMQVPLTFLPRGTKAGDMLLYRDRHFEKAEEKQRERREGIADKLSKLLGLKDPPDATQQETREAPEPKNTITKKSPIDEKIERAAARREELAREHRRTAGHPEKAGEKPKWEQENSQHEAGREPRSDAARAAEREARREQRRRERAQNSSPPDAQNGVVVVEASDAPAEPEK